MKWESENIFTCRLSRRDFRTLRRSAKKLDCSLTVVEREGVPFFLGRLRRRHALLAGALLCGGLLLWGSFFIWDFTVEGNRRVTEEEILRALEENGVGLGTFGIGLDTENIRNHVLLDIPELVWITVRVSGCRATVEVRERDETPEPVDQRAPSNVVARRDGLVLEGAGAGRGAVRAAGHLCAGGRAADLRRGGHADRGSPGPGRYGRGGGADLVLPDRRSAPDRGGEAVYRGGAVRPGPWCWAPAV